jgi:putative salt-induced outer membrane protein
MPYQRNAAQRARHVLACMLLALPLLMCGEARAEWTGKGEAGLVLANGNTETKNANVKLDLATTREAWKHAVGLAAI